MGAPGTAHVPGGGGQGADAFLGDCLDAVLGAGVGFVGLRGVVPCSAGWLVVQV